MKHIKKFNENSNENHDISEITLGATHTISDTNATFVIDGEEYGFTIRESGNDGGSDYKVEFLSDHDLPFELTKEMEDIMFSMYQNEAI